MATSVIEKELTCSICTELLFDPVTFLNCLHHNCGACAKRWFGSQAHNPPTCPVCRRLVKSAGVSPIVVSILADFLERFPDRGRTPEEMDEMRGVWKPGEELLPPSARAAGGEGIRGMNLMPPSPRLLTRLLSPPPEEVLPIQIYHNPPRHRPRSPVRAALPLAARRPSIPPSALPSTVLEILHRGISPIIITCDHCTRRLDTAVHLECSTCPLFHLCLRCFRAGRTCPSPNHCLTRQKLISSWPRRYLQVGIFCDVCDGWLDEDRNGGARVDAMFWRCNSCNDSRGWSYCTRCVQRGWNCTHELEMWSNNRTTSSGTLIRGSPRLPTPSLDPIGAASGLLGSGYTPFLFLTAVACTLCKLAIGEQNSQWLHCFGCPEPHGDLCTTCFYNLHRTFPSPTRSLHSFYTCPRGHAMGVLAQHGKRVLHRGVFAHAPRPRAPEWIRGGGGGKAVAVRGHWPEEEDASCDGDDARKWGRGQWLCFPAGAEVLDVASAFVSEDRRVEWFWGSYSGVGGLFPGEYVAHV
ncbi:hypothetical protein BZA05DRAFT_330493 [Tricharina praecox]|uniref:uncharacterized protein n=1 Tax=Tricharina praecox TaxID=43433 RepID=UPI00221FB89B|nr:uncharacterized protein BZA05DRAFT_330493 [Tricharina praecox]KAI5858325.1 hypothetical protein BZA05DRAFT_330493 [Tricharina praecox]